VDIRSAFRWQRGRPALRGLAALACVVLVGGLLPLGAARQQNRARFWLDPSSAAAADYQRLRERFSATDLRVLRLSSRTLQERSPWLTDVLRGAPGVLEVVTPSESFSSRRARTTADYRMCNPPGGCYDFEYEAWLRVLSLRGPLSAELRLLDPHTETAHLAVFARSQLDGAWGYEALDPPESEYEEAEEQEREPPQLAFFPRAHSWLETHLWAPLLFGAACLLALRRHCWRLALAAVVTAALAAAASEALLVATRQPASIAEPSAQFVIFVLVLGATLEVLNTERTVRWLSGAEQPWRAAHVGAGRAALGLGALALGSASFALLPVPGLRSFALQSAAGLLLGAALVSSLLPTLAALLPRQKLPGTVPTVPKGGVRWQRWVLLGGVGVVVVWVVVPFRAAAQGFDGQFNWPAYLGFIVVLFGLPLAIVSFRRAPGWLQRRSPLELPARVPEPLQRVLDVYVSSLVLLYALAMPTWLTAAPGSAERLGPEAFVAWDESQGPRPYSVVPLTRLELVLTTPESQLSEAGLAHLQRLAQRLKAILPTFGVLEPGVLLREAAYQLDRPASLPGPWLADAGLAGRLLAQYVADEGHTTRMTLLLEPPPRLTPVAFARVLPLESVAWHVKAELPEAELTITGPERLISEAGLDPLRLATVLVLALGLASSLPRWLQRAVPPPE